MQAYKLVGKRILAAVLSMAMVLPTLAFAAEADAGEAQGGTIRSFNKLDSRFSQSTEEGAPIHIYGLSVEVGTTLEELQLPAELTVMVEKSDPITPPPGSSDVVGVDADEPTVVQENISVTWDGNKVYNPDVEDEYTYTCALPEGYLLGDGVQKPQIIVSVDGEDEVNGITIEYEGKGGVSGVAEGASLEEAAEKVGIENIRFLKVTAGGVTKDDWNYIKNLTSLIGITIDPAVTKVADIPSRVPGDPVLSESVSTLIIPQKIKIGDSAFAECEGLNKVDLQQVTTIGAGAFSGCTGLFEAIIPMVTTIKDKTFEGCARISSIESPKVTAIGARAFKDCAYINSIDLSKVTTIGARAFEGCSELTKLTVPTAVPTVGENAFKDCAESRDLRYVGEDGKALLGDALAAAVKLYNSDKDGNTEDELWYGWKTVNRDMVVEIDGKKFESSSLSEVLANVGGGGTIKVIGGKVTEQDWKSLTKSGVVHFEIDPSVTEVADIPETNGEVGTLPESIETIKVPQAIKIGISAFQACDKLTSVSFPGVTEISHNAFLGCHSLTSVSFPAVTKIGSSVFAPCYALKSASFPSLKEMGGYVFSSCKELGKLSLPAVPPSAKVDTLSGFAGYCYVEYVGADGVALTGDALAAAKAKYKADDDGDTTDSLWYGFHLDPKGTSGGDDGGSSSGSSSSTSGASATGNIINNPVGTQTAPPAVTQAVKDAVAKGATNTNTRVTFNNYSALAPDGIKAMLDAVAKATAGTNVKLSLLANFDSTIGNTVMSRITMDPAKLEAVVKENVKLGVYYNQQSDSMVNAVNAIFEEHFDNKIVSIVYEQRSTLNVNAEFCAKLNLKEVLGSDSKLYFYNYDATKNAYNPIAAPNHWVDKYGYDHITAPFGGAIIISAKPLTKK